MTAETASWRGVFPYLPTPTDATGRFDAARMRAVVARCIAAGVHGVTPLGSSGELPLLPRATRVTVIRTVAEAVGGRVPVVAGVGGFGTAQIVADAQAAVDAGSDGILLAPFAYYPLRTSEILSLIERVVSRVEVPVVLYNNPTVTHVDIGRDVIVRAHRELGVRYVKEASGAISRIREWRDATNGGVDVFAATAISPTAAMLLGAVGWMSGPASVFPRESVSIFELARGGDWRGAARAEAALDPALRVFRTLGPARGVKALFCVVGASVGEPIPPLAPLTEEELTAAARLVGRRRDAAAGRGR